LNCHDSSHTMEESTGKSIKILSEAVRQSTRSDFRTLKTVAQLLKVTVYIKQGDDDELSRVLFRSDGEDKLHRFNGIIFDKNGDVISYPVRRIIDAQMLGESDKFLSVLQTEINKYDYKVYHASNGTVVTIYYYMGNWRLSTSRGIEVDKYVLIGDKTYRQIFDELLTMLHIDMISFEQTKCYSFVMSHPTYHILPYKALVFLGGYDLKMKQFFNEAAAPQFSEIKQATKSLGKKETLALRLHDFTSSSIARFFASINSTTDPNYYPKLFGFILRTTHPDGLDYYIESDMMEILKLGVFSTYRNKTGATDRVAYFIMKIWLIGQNEPFWLHILGPTYTKHIKEFAMLLSQINLHLEQLRNKQIMIENIASKVYTDAMIRLLRDKVTWETIRSVHYLNTYYSIWEEAHSCDANVEIDQPTLP
jgi:hypothetical protein